MWGANTTSVLARFGDNNWEKGEDFVKTFLRQKTCVGDGGELERAGWTTCKTTRSCCEKRIKTKLCKSRLNSPTFAKVLENKSGQVVEKTFRPYFAFVWFRESNEI